MSTPTRTAPVLTAAGRDRLEARVRQLRDVELPSFAELLGDRDRDGRVDADYARARDELDRTVELLAEARPAEKLRHDPTIVELGELVTIELDDGTREQFLIVDPAEAALDDVRISARSPLAVALLGRTVGSQVSIGAPGGSYAVTIVGLEPAA